MGHHIHRFVGSSHSQIILLQQLVLFVIAILLILPPEIQERREPHSKNGQVCKCPPIIEPERLVWFGTKAIPFLFNAPNRG